MIYVLRDGLLVPKGSVREDQATARTRADFPTPRLSRLEPYQSPIDGHEVTSWAARDKELKDNNAYDPRDFSGTYPKSLGRKKNQDERPEPPVQLDLPFST